MNIVEGRTFKDQEIVMDFSVWRKCNFVNCKLIVGYGILRLQDNDFIDCVWLFPKDTPAGTVHAILEMIGALK